MHPQIQKLLSDTNTTTHKILFLELCFRMESDKDSIFSERRIEEMFQGILTPTEIEEALEALILYEAVDYYDNGEFFMFRGVAAHEKEPYNQWLKIRELVFATGQEAMT